LNNRRSFLLGFIFFQSVFFINCAHIITPPDDQPAARQTVERLEAIGDAISQFKGLGHLRMESNGQIVSGRIAVAALAPDKMRVEWLNMMGQPLTSLCGDGETITVYSRSDKKIYRLKQSPTGLEPLIQIPIGIEDLRRILVGSIPLRDNTFVQFDPGKENEGNLVFKDRWHSKVATILLDRGKSRVRSLKAYDRQGDLQYEIQWEQWQDDGRVDLPVRIVMQSDSRKRRLILTMDRFWPNAEVPLSTFVLEVPSE
jgi:outer membrane biogenesis lipoprotein LolB